MPVPQQLKKRLEQLHYAQSSIDAVLGDASPTQTNCSPLISERVEVLML